VAGGSPIGFGTWGLGGRAYGTLRQDAAFAAIRTALELGVDLFDTANIYGDGRAERILGKALPADSSVAIISKCGYVREGSSEQVFTRDALRRSVEKSLMRLRRPRLDVLLLHSPPRHALLAGEAFAALDEMRSEGLVDTTGISLRSVDDWELATRWEGCSVVELILNLLDQRAVDRGITEEAEDAGIVLIARVPLCFGLLSGRHRPGAEFRRGDQRSRWPREQLDAWITGAARFGFLARDGRTLAQAALAWVIAQPAVRAAIPGMKTPEQVRENVAAHKVQLEPEELQFARATWQEVTSVVP
jgi:aryl-alcohol dehydrogenase-like predicted oxidoreductase